MDTICALATAAVEAGIGIVRVSGPEAIPIVSALVRTGSGKGLDISESHRIKYGFIYYGDSVLDEVLIMTMRAPRSYTGEDTVEIDCHGGVLMMKRIVEAVLSQGARLAEPGEFTKRAFLNGRIDLSKAEAVGELITAENDKALRASVEQLRGSVSASIKKMRGRLLEDTAFIEAALDDPEHISMDGFLPRLEEDVQNTMKELSSLIASAENGKILREGIKTVILGKPNAGKSSLLNALVGSDRAIVSDIAGTTRDTLEEHIRLSGISLHVIDTAGIRETEDTVERIGVERALRAGEAADLILYVVDASVPLDSSDERIMAEIKDRECIILLNKSDLVPVVTEQFLEEKTGKPVVSISAKENTGLDRFEKLLEERFYHREIDFNHQLIITSARHKQCLMRSLAALKRVWESMTMGMPEDIFAVDLMDAYTELGYILGEEVSEDLINEIFSKFCMGK